MSPTCHLDANARLVSLLQPLAHCDGFLPTAIDGLRVVSSHGNAARCPQIYDPSLMIIAQGSKIAYLGERALEYGAGHYLVQALPVPFQYETFATEQLPLLGVSIPIDRLVLGELVLAMGPAEHQVQTPSSMVSAELDEDMRCAVERLLECLHDPQACRILGQSRLREVLFAALRGPQGGVLRALVEQQGQFARIAGALTWLHSHFDQPLQVDELARRANMSASTFHEHFKRATMASPIQYLKQLRLIKARSMLVAEGMSVSQVAHRVGYQSSSQFSREYKRYFARSPAQERLPRAEALAN
ncbi:AraC family transcriptional regulator [Pseudomonas sp. App30]|uniref:AraC family transcriptional regulator n=1 Tax=Pseudomonas sp. App30 TaxID=3068990 RepID=UPI003A81009B